MVVLQASEMEQVVVMSSLMDQGIIQAMKANYRKSMLHSSLAAVRKFNTATEFAKSVTVFDAIRWISSLGIMSGKKAYLRVTGELVLRRQRLIFRSRKTTQASPIKLAHYQKHCSLRFLPKTTVWKTKQIFLCMKTSHPLLREFWKT